jgi:hypothetical protein
VFGPTPGVGTNETMTRLPASGPSSRSAAVGDLFAALEGLLISYQALPEAEREQRWTDEAELITGAVALHLSTARGRIAARSRPRPAIQPHPVPPSPPQPPTTQPPSSGPALAAPVPEPGVDPTDGRRPA